MKCSANQEQVLLQLDQSGMRRFALEEKKIKKQCLSLDQSLFNNFPPLCCKENYFNLMTSIEGDLRRDSKVTNLQIQDRSFALTGHMVQNPPYWMAKECSRFEHKGIPTRQA